jgi:hypothetical protein
MPISDAAQKANAAHGEWMSDKAWNYYAGRPKKACAHYIAGSCRFGDKCGDEHGKGVTTKAMGAALREKSQEKPDPKAKPAAPAAKTEAKPKSKPKKQKAKAAVAAAAGTCTLQYADGSAISSSEE